MADPFAVLPISDESTFMIRSIRFRSVSIDETPDDFTLTPLVDQNNSQLVDSNIITVSGLDNGLTAVASIDFETSDLTASLSVNGGPFEQASYNVANGDTVQLRVQTPSSSNSLVRVVLSIGGVTATWLVSTATTIVIPVNIAFSRAPFALARTTTAIAVGFSSTQAGQYRVIMTPFGQLPTVDEVLAGTGQGGVLPLFDSGLLSLAALTQLSAFASGLTPGTAYAFHVALIDELGDYKAIGRLNPATTLPVEPVVSTSYLMAPSMVPEFSPQISRTLLKRLR